MEFGQVVQCVLPATTEAGHLMSKTLPPKINLHEGRRGGRRRGRREGGGKEGKAEKLFSVS